MLRQTKEHRDDPNRKEIAASHYFTCHMTENCPFFCTFEKRNVSFMNHIAVCINGIQKGSL